MRPVLGRRGSWVQTYRPDQSSRKLLRTTRSSLRSIPMHDGTASAISDQRQNPPPGPAPHPAPRPRSEVPKTFFKETCSALTSARTLSSIWTLRLQKLNPFALLFHLTPFLRLEGSNSLLD